MNVFLVMLALIIFVCLIVVATFRPDRPSYSLAELKRRAKKSEAFVLELDRYELHPALTTLLRIVRALLLVLLVGVLIGAFGWFGGIIIALLLAVVYPMFARLQVVRTWGLRLYTRVEPWLLDTSARFEKVFHFMREPGVILHEAPRRLRSREDLADLIEQSGDVVGDKEKALLSAALAFQEKKVEEIMTPRSVIDFIKKDEFLGPLVLDELHALGHSRLPVIDGDLDHVTGILHLRDLLSLDVKRSSTAEKAMEAKVFYIREDASLEHALSAFIRTRHHLFIVINRNRETVGLVTLEDVLEKLIGRRIIDEDDIHADLRAVAEQEGERNNVPSGHVDL